MTKGVFFILFFLFVNSNVFADILSDYLSVVPNPQLTETERRSLQVIEDWQKGKRTSPISIGYNGEVEIIFGLTQPQILCAVLQVTDIQLEAGEKIYGVHLGDTARWVVEPAFAGSEKGDITHIIIKPKDVDLLTSLIITTDKRTYHLKLKSHKTEYYPMVKFSYPDQLQQKFKVARSQQDADKASKTLESGEYLDNLNFSYKLKGNAKFKPTRVYNDGVKTIIELPSSVKSDNVPTIFLIQEESADPVLVNYRLQNNKIIVDAVFDKAILISGIGYRQEKITIIKDK